MRINSRTKGACGEREFAAKIHELTEVRLVRNLEQTRSGGHDLIVDGGEDNPMTERFRQLAIEVKRYKIVTEGKIKTWWQQARHQAEATNLAPVLAYRGNNQTWRVIVPLHLINPEREVSHAFSDTASVEIDTFCQLLNHPTF